MRQYHFWVVGGDQRQAALANALSEDGHQVHAWALDRAEFSNRVERPETPDEIRRADCVIFPLPIRGEGETLNAPLCPETHLLEDVFARLRPAQYLCAGRIDERTQALAARYALRVHDYFLREELAVANAVPTALAV